MVCAEYRDDEAGTSSLLFNEILEATCSEHRSSSNGKIPAKLSDIVPGEFEVCWFGVRCCPRGRFLVNAFLVGSSLV